jgi:hypothetical protein
VEKNQTPRTTHRVACSTEVDASAKTIAIVVEQHSDAFVAYPLGLTGVVVGQGETSEAAVADVTSAIRFHAETFGAAVLDPTLQP